jgi:hypothetical protein
MGITEPTNHTVWDQHPGLLSCQAVFDQTVARGQGRVVLVAGGPASGRTGLARALAERLAAHPARPVVVAGGFNDDGGWEPWPASDPTRWVASLQAGVDLAAKVLGLGGTVGVPGAGVAAGLLGQLAATSSAARTVLDRHAKRSQPLPGGTGSDAVREVLRVAAGPQLVVGWQPVVCILDDLDRALDAYDWWSGLLVRLGGELRDLSLLLVVTLDGPEQLGGHVLGEPTGLWAARRLVEGGVGRWLPVRRLDQAAVAAWLGPCEPSLAEQLWEVTGGEPRWLGELWEYWRSTRVVRRDLTGQWVFGVQEHAGLGKVHDLIWDQLYRHYGRMDDDHIDAVVRWLGLGALEGRQFTAEAVAVVVDRDADDLIDEFDEHLVAGDGRPDGLLADAGFVEIVDPRATNAGPGQGRTVFQYRFVSELHWRTLRWYGLLGGERQDGCRALATALEQVWQPEPDRAAAVIASLLREAGDSQAAATWKARADFGALVPVVEAHARLLLATDTAAWDWSDHAQATRQLEHAANVLFHHRPAEALLEVAQGWARAAEAAGWRLQLALALRYWGQLHERRGEDDAALALYRRARREAVAAGELPLAARTMGDRASMELGQGWVRLARRRAQAARQFAHRHHAPFAEAAALEVLAAAAVRVGDWQGAHAAAKDGVAVADDAGDLLRLSLLLPRLVEAQEALGLTEQARATVDRALDAARQVGARSLEGGAAMLAADLWATVDDAVTQRHLLRALTIANQLDERPSVVKSRIRLAALAYRSGDASASRAELLAATRFATGIDVPELQAELWTAWARLAEAEGLPAGRVAVLWAVVAYHAEQAGHGLATSMWEAAGRALADAGEPGDRVILATRAAAVLADNHGLGLLDEAFGPFDADRSASLPPEPGST